MPSNITAYRINPAKGSVPIPVTFDSVKTKDELIPIVSSALGTPNTPVKIEFSKPQNYYVCTLDQSKKMRKNHFFLSRPVLERPVTGPALIIGKGRRLLASAVIPPDNMVIKNTVKKKRKPEDFFKKHLSQVLRSEGKKVDIALLSRESSNRWKAMSDEAKAPFAHLSEEDGARYQKELAAWQERYPPRPRASVSAYNAYCRHHGGSIASAAAEWKTLSDDKKAPFVQEAAMDKVRHQAEMEEWSAKVRTLGYNLNVYKRALKDMRNKRKRKKRGQVKVPSEK